MHVRQIINVKQKHSTLQWRIKYYAHYFYFLNIVLIDTGDFSKNTPRWEAKSPFPEEALRGPHKTRYRIGWYQDLAKVS